MTARIEITNSDLKIFEDFQEFLITTWSSDSSRPWDIYTSENPTRFWDVRMKEARTKK